MRNIGKIIKKITIFLLFISVFISLFSIVKVFAEGDKFKISDVSIDSKSQGVDASILSFDDDELNTSITFHNIDEYVTFKLLIKNISSDTYKLKIVSDNSSNNYVDYEYQYDENTSLSPNDTTEVLLKAVYKTELTDLTIRNQNEEFKITFVLEDENGNISTDDINVNTGDNVLLYVNSLIISVVGLIIIFVRNKRTKKIMVLVLLLVPIGVMAIAPSLVVTFTTNSKLFDKVVITKDVNGEEVLIGIPYNTVPERPADPVVEGYTFDCWTLNGEPYNFDHELTDDISLTAEFTPIDYDIHYDLDDGNVTGNPDTYNIETATFDLINPNKEGYTFSGWTGSNGENLQTRVTIEQGSTGEKSFVAHFSPNPDTRYTVNHNYKRLDGTYETIPEELNGATGTTVKPSAREVYGFVNPELEDLEILPDGSATLDYFYNRVEYNLTLLNSEDIDTTFTGTKYPYQTEITLTAKNKEHYNFVKWSNNETDNPLTFEIENDTEIGPVYEAIKYRVSFDSQGGIDVNDMEVPYNTEIGELPETLRSNYIFDGWYTDTNYTTKVTTSTKVFGEVTYYAKWRKSVALANISNENVELERDTTELIELTNVEEEYTFTSNNTSIATIDDNGLITAKTAGTTTITITGSESTKTRTINVTVLVTKYYVTWDSQGGNDIPISKIPVDTEVGTLPIPVYDGQAFLGWYTDPTGGTQISDTTVISGDIAFYAHWTPLVCKIASSLHTETCEKTSYGCFAAGYTLTGTKNTNIIKYGTLVTSGTLTPGYAFDCDVNGDGTYDSDTERFYYLRTLGDNAVLISHTNFEGDERGQKIDNTYSYDEITDMLPSTSKWSNLTVTFGNSAARVPTYDDLKAACGSDDLRTSGDLDACIYILENSRFASDNQGRSGVWLAKVGNTTHRYHTNTRAVTTNTSSNAVRPVIEVPLIVMDKSYIEAPKATVTFDSQGGSDVDSMQVEIDTTIDSLPEATWENNTFEGWYTDTTYTTLVTTSRYIYEDVTFYAKWEKQPVAQVGNKKYTVLQEAIDEAPNNSTVLLLQDLNVNLIIQSGKTITIDLGGHTLKNDDTESVIINNANVTVTNGSIVSNGGTAAVHNNSSGIFTINDGAITATNTKQAIYNNGGTVYIGGTAELTASSSQRPTVHNVSNGTVIITGGTIVSKKQQAVGNEGTLVIGSENSSYDATNPVLQGKTYGLTTTTPFDIYDGILKGETGAINDETKIDKTEQFSVKVTDTEGSYNVLYYTISNTNKYVITFDPKGGTVSPATKQIDVGDEIGTLPEPDKGIYTFEGWYTDDVNYTTRVYANTKPTGSVTYYAKWSYTSSNEIVNFNTTNDVMTTYYSNISTWKTNQSTFEDNMINNFNNYNCKCKDGTCSTSGTVSCDKPKGYDTGAGQKINVYLSSTNKEKGDEVDYTLSDSGVIYNMIPNQIYYWELDGDSTVYGYVKALGERRIVEVNNVGNVRDLGGLKVDTDGDGTVDGTLKYGVLFRGEKLGANGNAKDELKDLGVTLELDLRKASERANDEVALPNFKQIELIHYQIDLAHYPDNYAKTRAVVKQVMEDVVAGENIYFHCRIGADRTGTLAYILEGLLGVVDEDKLEDYDMTVFSGLVNRHRFYSYDASSSVSKTEKFMYMYDFMEDNGEILTWYRAAMIESN